jgi:hypothetical protein
MTVGDELSVESALDAFLADGHSRTRATELVIEATVTQAYRASTVVLVEGISDRIALEIIARRVGRDLTKDGIAVVAMGGATNVAKFVTLFGNARVAGLYDIAQERHVARSLARTGLDVAAGLGSIGFFACVADLEDELIRAVGIHRVEQIVEAAGEIASLRRMQHEPFHRGASPEQQVHRFISARAGRKYQYARLLSEAMDVARIPRPLAELLGYL